MDDEGQDRNRGARRLGMPDGVDRALADWPTPSRSRLEWDEAADQVCRRILSGEAPRSLAEVSDEELLVAPLPPCPDPAGRPEAKAPPPAGWAHGQSGDGGRTPIGVARRPFADPVALAAPFSLELRDRRAFLARPPRHRSVSSEIRQPSAEKHEAPRTYPRAVAARRSWAAAAVLGVAAAAAVLRVGVHGKDAARSVAMSSPASDQASAPSSAGDVTALTHSALGVTHEAPQPIGALARARGAPATDPDTLPAAPRAERARARTLHEGATHGAIPVKRRATPTSPQVLAAQAPPSPSAAPDPGEDSATASAEPPMQPAAGIVSTFPSGGAGERGMGSVPLKPPFGAVEAALGEALPEARACLAPTDPIAHAIVTFQSGGRVESVLVWGGIDDRHQACVREALSRAHVDPFVEPSFRAPVTVRPD